MKSVFIADINKYVPTNDCYIMAQATIEKCCLLTGNGQDFVFNKRNEDKNVHDRVRGIVHINILNGYYDEAEDEHKITPAPILIYTLGPILKYGSDDFETNQQSDDKVKAEHVL